MPAMARPRNDRRLSALPSVRARSLAFVAILVAGVCGAVIGWSFVDISCTGDCDTAAGAGGVVGGLLGAGGVAIVAVLVLRAMNEWQRIQDEDEPLQPDSVSRRNPSA